MTHWDSTQAFTCLCFCGSMRQSWGEQNTHFMHLECEIELVMYLNYCVTSPQTFTICSYIYRLGSCGLKLERAFF